MNGSFELWYIDRNTATASTFEGTFTADYVAKYTVDAKSIGAEVERYDGFARLVFERHEDGRPWVYTEFYPVRAATRLVAGVEVPTETWEMMTSVPQGM